jgi:integrase
MIERQNYLKTRKHLTYLEEVLQLTPASLERYRFYLRHLLLWARDKDFKNIQEIRPTFPTYLSTLPGKDGKGILAGTTQKKILDISKRFFRWAKPAYPRELNTLPLVWIETLRLTRQPQITSENVFVSEDEVKRLIAYPTKQDDLALLRDQAAAAMLFLSGMRGSAFVTLPISALDLENLTVLQWPELGVHTKNSKKATTFLLNIPDLLAPVRYWDAIVRPALPPSTPWYTPIEHCWGEQSLSHEEPGKCRLNGLEKRLKLLFSLAKLEFKSPHKFRHGHAVFGLLHAQTMADYKAVSMNLMHDSIEITDSIYAPMISSDVRERIAGLSGKAVSTPNNELESYLNHLGKEGLGRALVFIAGKLTQ